MNALKNYIIIILAFSYSVLNAQISISTYQEQLLMYDEEEKEYKELDSLKSCSGFFEINKNVTMMEHTTKEMTSHYKIEDFEIDDSTSILTASIVSDVGNKYKMQIDKEYQYVAFTYMDNDTIFTRSFQTKNIWGEGAIILNPKTTEATASKDENKEADGNPIVAGSYAVTKVSDYAWDTNKKKYEVVRVVGVGKIVFSGKMIYFKRGDAKWLDNELVYKGYNEEEEIHIYKDKRGQKLYLSKDLNKLTYYYDYDESIDKYLSATLYKDLELETRNPDLDFVKASN